MNKYYTHIHLYVEKYDKYEKFLLLDFVDKKEFYYFRQRFDFPVQNIDNEKTMDIRNAALEEEGEYFTKIFLDGEEMGKYPIKIKKAV